MTSAHEIDNDALLDVLCHPLRRRLLRQYIAWRGAYGLGPKDVAETLGMPLSNVSYHIRVLVRNQLLELVSEVQVRGSVAHFYEATSKLKETEWALVALDVEDWD